MRLEKHMKLKAILKCVLMGFISMKKQSIFLITTKIISSIQLFVRLKQKTLLLIIINQFAGKLS